MQDLIGYEEIIEKSMRSVIFEALKIIEKKGLVGEHYFVIRFLTNFPGVSIPKHLLKKYPEEMNIAIQHQFKSLVVDSEFFKISLSFNGKYEKLVIPYRSITSFSDPSMNFILKFSATFLEFEGDASQSENEENTKLAIKSQNRESNIDLSAKVISLEDFRKNRNNQK